MCQLIDQHEVGCADQGGDDAGVGEIARAEHAGRMRALHAGKAALQLREQRMIAGDEPRAAAADAVAFERRDRRFLDGWMVGEVEIVVAAERQQAAPVANRPDAVKTVRLDQHAAQAVALELGELLGGEVIQ